MASPQAAARALNLTEGLGDEHRRLRQVLDDLLRAAGEAKLEAAATSFAALRRGLERIIAVKDEMVFPVFEERTGMRDSGPTITMRREHREIERRLGIIGDALSRQDPAAVVAQATELGALLDDHGQREEDALYPTCDRLLGARERARVLRAAGHKRR